VELLNLINLKRMRKIVIIKILMSLNLMQNIKAINNKANKIITPIKNGNSINKE